MKAMVLAAGLGTRMRPLTRRIAKGALPVLNRPLIHWTLERLAAAGVTDVIVNLHHYFIDGVIWKIRNPKVRRDLFAHLSVAPPPGAGPAPARVASA